MTTELIPIPAQKSPKKEKKVILDESMEKHLDVFPDSIKEAYEKLPKRTKKKILDYAEEAKTLEESKEGNHPLFGLIKMGTKKDLIKMLEDMRHQEGFYTKDDIYEMNPLFREIKTSASISIWMEEIDIYNEIAKDSTAQQAIDKLMQLLELIWENRDKEMDDMHVFKEEENKNNLKILKELSDAQETARQEILNLAQRKKLTKPQKARLELLQRNYWDSYSESPTDSRKYPFGGEEGSPGVEMEDLLKQNKKFALQADHFRCMVEFLKYLPADEAAVLFSEKVEFYFRRTRKGWYKDDTPEYFKDLLDTVDKWYEKYKNDQALKTGETQLSESQEKRLETLIQHFWNYVQSYKVQLEREASQSMKNNTITEMEVLLGIMGRFK